MRTVGMLVGKFEVAPKGDQSRHGLSLFHPWKIPLKTENGLASCCLEMEPMLVDQIQIETKNGIEGYQVGRGGSEIVNEQPWIV